jgi:hypothetical protein
MDKFELERLALTGDKEAISKVISDLRRYRIACKILISSRWGDCTVDGVCVRSFISDIEDIENIEESA